MCIRDRAKAVLVFVLISVMGTVNGLVMGSIRMPHALALRGMVPGAATLERVNARLDIPVPSAILSFAASALWLGLHYWSQRGGWLPNADLSECTVAFSYLFYMAVYFLLIRLFFRGKAGGWVSGVPVSYTHLDVYKRQAKKVALRRCLFCTLKTPPSAARATR